MDVFLIICCMLIPLIMIFIGLLWRKHPPKKINSIYGYRTSMSRKSKETWEYAHSYFSSVWFWSGLVTLVMSAICILILKDHNDFETNTAYLAYGQIAIMLAGIIPTELALHKHFDTNGKIKE